MVHETKFATNSSGWGRSVHETKFATNPNKGEDMVGSVQCTRLNQLFASPLYGGGKNRGGKGLINF